MSASVLINNDEIGRPAAQILLDDASCHLLATPDPAVEDDWRLRPGRYVRPLVLVTEYQGAPDAASEAYQRAADYWRRRPGTNNWKRRGGKDDCPAPRPNLIGWHRQRFEEWLPEELLKLNIYDGKNPWLDYLLADGRRDVQRVGLPWSEKWTASEWTPTHPRIFGDERDELPAWWRKEFGKLWDWNPAAWARTSSIQCDCKFCQVMRDSEVQDFSSVHRFFSYQGKPSNLIEIPERFRKQAGLDDGLVFHYWGPERFPEPPKIRPARFEGMPRSERELVNRNLNQGALDERFMSAGLLAAAKDLKTLDSYLNKTTFAQIYSDLDHLDSALATLIPEAAPLDPSIYETTQMIAVGSFMLPSTGSVVAHSTRWTEDPHNEAAIAEYEAWKLNRPTWAQPTNRRKNLWGNSGAEPDDFHGRMWRAQVAEVPINDKPPKALTDKFEAHAADLKRLRDEYTTDINAQEMKKNPKRPLVFSMTGEDLPNGPVATIEFTALKPSEGLMKEWNARLADEAAKVKEHFKKDSKLGLEHTGLEELGNEELRSLKYRKSRAIPKDYEETVDEDEVSDEDEAPVEVTPVAGADDEAEYEEVEAEDDDLDTDNEEAEAFSESGSETSNGTCYVNDPRFSDDEDAVGPPEGHHHIIPMYEDNTCETNDPYDHEDLEAARGLAESRKNNQEEASRIPVVMTMVQYNRTPEEALEICGVDAKPKTAQKWKERFMEDAMIFKGRPNGIPDADLTDEMLVDIKEGAAYVLLDLENGWKYHKLDTDTYATLAACVQALKEQKIQAAWKESDLRKATQKDFIKHKKHKKVRRLELQKIRERFDERFEKHWVARDPNQWPKSTNHRGLVADAARREGLE